MRASMGAYAAWSRSERTCSTPLFEAPSISTRSASVPASAASQRAQALQGSGPGPCSQFSALAKMRAVVVLPVPRGPAKR